MPAHKNYHLTRQTPVIRRLARLAASLGPLIESAGLARVEPPLPADLAAVWSATDAEGTRVVDIQRSPHWRRDCGVFTVNLGVHLPAVARVLGRDETIGGTGVGWCNNMHRLGSLVRGEDVWWTLDAQTDLPALARELGAMWASHGLAWLERCRSAAGTRAWLIEIRGRAGVVSDLAVGDRAAARVSLHEDLLASPSADYSEHLIAVGVRNGLLAPQDADLVRAALQHEPDARRGALDLVFAARRG